MGDLDEQVVQGVQAQSWSHKPEGFLLYTLSRGGMIVRITNWGATVVSLVLTDDSDGSKSDVVLGFDSVEPYTDGTSPYFGCIVGRVANRIKDATFTIEGQAYSLPANHNSNTLHGGHRGFDKVLWQSRIVKESENPSVEFTYHSSDGEQGFPGDLDVKVTYSLLTENELRVEMEATPKNKPTPVSLAQHSYWNLAGHNKGTILDHTLTVAASHYTPVDQVQIPTGEIVPVSGTPFDFAEETRIGSRIEQVEGGYDHNYVLDGWRSGDGAESLHPAARLRDPASGWTMELQTSAPAVQVYTGNFLEAVPGKGGCVYRKHAGICLETQGFPNAVNEPKFPSMLVAPGEVYKHVMVYKFHKA